MFVTAILAAGGRGRRFGGARLKQLVEIGGRPMLERSVDAFLAHPAIDEIVVALPDELVSNPPAYLRDRAKAVRVVGGGERRQDSVGNAFRAASPGSEVFVIHDAARPFASAGLITRTLEAAAESGAALAALAARDTVKRVDQKALDRWPASAGLLVAETLPRETVFLAQTPQAFRRHVLHDALACGERDAIDATDEAALAERAGHQVRIVEGEATNIKITTAEDLPIAEAIARSAALRQAQGTPSQSRGESLALRHTAPNASVEREPFGRAVRTGRAGTGYDLHRLIEGRPLVVGGVTIASDRGPLGHSDGDVVCHAITDALLGALSLGDIGGHFPDTDPRWKDASSVDLLSRAAALVAERGYEVGNVDVTVILETPKLRDHIDAMRQSVGRALGIDASRVSIKGKTNEGVDAIGRGEAIAAHAVVLVRSLD
jgi:2-C-methyl-D-erythritol 4-phosphate cytidylyltransferase/2-C-methyl-D-erythritol 2,4-cyclodiphosphate synthase